MTSMGKLCEDLVRHFNWRRSVVEGPRNLVRLDHVRFIIMWLTEVIVAISVRLHKLRTDCSGEQFESSLPKICCLCSLIGS